MSLSKKIWRRIMEYAGQKYFSTSDIIVYTKKIPVEKYNMLKGRFGYRSVYFKVDHDGKLSQYKRKPYYNSGDYIEVTRWNDNKSEDLVVRIVSSWSSTSVLSSEQIEMLDVHLTCLRLIPRDKWRNDR